MGTSRNPFLRYLESEGLKFGLGQEMLERIESRTRAGAAISELLEDSELTDAGVGPTHLLRIRRAFHRFQAKGRPDLPAAARRWAVRHAADGAEQDRLASAFSVAVQATLKKGRLRFHLKRPDHTPEELIWLTEHTEGCDELPAHRWFAARRGIKDGLVWVDVLACEGEVERALGTLASGELKEDLTRSMQKSVLDAITARSEREVISTAADGLYGLLSRPPIEGPVAGLAVSRKRIWICVLDSEGSEEQGEFGIRDLDGVAAFVQKKGGTAAGVARAGGSGSVSPVIKSLASLGLTVEPVRETGLMKQASKRPGPIKAAAAVVVAWRLKNPLDGFAGLDADELGLGEYTDQVSPDNLRAALEDARQVVGWERKHGKIGRPVARGMDISPMVEGLADLRPGMELTGSVANLTHFGAFVELGLATQGLIHLSELSDQFIKHPSEVVAVGDRVRVRVLTVDQKKNRISLTMRSESKLSGRKPRDRRGAALSDLDKLFKK